MKKITLLFVFIAAIITSSLKAQESPDNTGATQPNKNAPVITFTKLENDFGKINKGSDGTCEFVFKNTGKDPLILSNARASCGCTTPDWTKEPVNKGKTGSIKVKYNTNNIGQFTKTVTVYSNASNNPIILTIKGEVIDVPQPANQ